MKRSRLPIGMVLSLTLGLTGCSTPTPAAAPSPPPPVSPAPASEAIAQEPPWYEAYKAILADWTLIEGYGDVSYLSFYFGDDYIFDTYWLCDVDGNGTPELLLHSGAMGITVTLTYHGAPVVLDYDALYGVNKETAELVTHGHWHGAGGTWTNEWRSVHVAGGTADQTLYIDLLDAEISPDVREPHVTITRFYGETFEDARSPTVEEYDALYAEHVAPCTKIEEYRWYELNDLSGLEQVQS